MSTDTLNPAPTLLVEGSQTCQLRGTGADIVRIRPSAGWRAVNLVEVWRYRELLWFLALRDVKLRYKQTALGVAWAVIQPLFTMIVFSVFFGGLGKIHAKHAASRGWP